MTTSVKPLLKAGWLRALLFVIPWIFLSIVLETIGQSLTIKIWGGEEIEMGGNLPTLLKVLIAAIGSTLFIWLWRKIIDRRSLVSLGFEWKNYSTDGWIGFFTGPALLGIGSIALVILGYLQYTSINFKPENFALELLLMLLVAYSEELIVRGYLLNNLLQSFNKWVALSITSVFFAVLHLGNPEVSVLSFTNILLAGLLLGINYIYTKNLWFGMLFHFSWNFFQGSVFGYEVSGLKFEGVLQQNLLGPAMFTGGSFGFEGSILCTLLVAMAVVLLSIYFSKKYYSPPVTS